MVLATARTLAVVAALVGAGVALEAARAVEAGEQPVQMEAAIVEHVEVALPFIERTPCHGSEPAPAVAQPTAPNQAQVTVYIPPRATVRVVDGAIVAAATNTGCAPRPIDGVVLENGDRAPAEVRAALLRCSRIGDWRTTGNWVELDCAA